MIISFSPKRSDETLTLSREGDILNVNGLPIDLSVIPEGATLPAEAIDSDWIVDAVERIDGVLHVTVVLPFSAGASEALRFPRPVTVMADGPVAVPHDPEQEEDHGDD